MNYLFVMLSAVLLAAEFSLNKKYQVLEGVSAESALRFNALSGFLSALILWIVSGFQIEWSLFSFGLALIMAVCCILYSMIGFRILKLGGLALYSTFLMSGGMLMPYFFGILFLHEELTSLRILGIIAVLVAVILSNFSKQKANREQWLLCIAVFVLNGFVSIISKYHQISSDYKAISSSDFVIYTSIGKCLFSTLAVLLSKERPVSAVKCKTSFPVIAGAAVVGAASYLLQLIGAKSLPATVLYPIVTGGSIIFSSIAGRLFFRELISHRQLFSIVLCLIGTLLFL